MFKNTMSNDSKLKIVFFAFHSTTALKSHWQHLNDRADCWWVTLHPDVYAEIKEMGCKKISFKSMICRKFRPIVLCKIINKFFSFYVERVIHKWINKMIDELNPDILISNTTKILSRYTPNNPKCMKVQVFHGISYNTNCLIPENLTYDLILLPGEYHKRIMCQNFNLSNDNQLKVVGWPSSDTFINNKFTKGDRDTFMKRFGLNSEFKNVLYAPSHSIFYRNGLFPKSFGSAIDAFEEFCKRIREMNVNLMIKLHPLSHKLIRDVRLHRIAEKYNVHLAYKNSTGHLDNSVEYYLWSTDVLISDVSGIIMDFMVLNRPIVYIELDGEGCKWEEADLPREFRAGEVVNSMDKLIEGVEKSLKNPDEYKFKRKEILQKVFYKLDGRASKRASDTILNYYKEFST